MDFSCAPPLPVNDAALPRATLPPSTRLLLCSGKTNTFFLFWLLPVVTAAAVAVAEVVVAVADFVTSRACCDPKSVGFLRAFDDESPLPAAAGPAPPCLPLVASFFLLFDLVYGSAVLGGI